MIECGKCNNTGYVIELKEDGTPEAKPCTCLKLRKQEMRLAKSGIKMDQYEKYSMSRFKANDGETKKMKELATRFLADRNAKGIGYFGKSGVGKTHICIAICLELTTKQDKAHTYFAYRNEIQKLSAAYYRGGAEYENLLNFYKICDNLYIDDLWKNSMNKNNDIDTLEKRITYDLINTRYLNNLTTLFTSEFSLNEISKIDSAIGGRIFEMIDPYGMVCDGKNKRLEKREFRFDPVPEKETVVEKVVEKKEEARKGPDPIKMAELKAKIKQISEKMENELNKGK